MVLRCLLTVEVWKEAPVNVFRSEAQVELVFHLSLKDKSTKCSLSDWVSFGGRPGLAWLLEVPYFGSFGALSNVLSRATLQNGHFHWTLTKRRVGFSLFSTVHIVE